MTEANQPGAGAEKIRQARKAYRGVRSYNIAGLLSGDEEIGGLSREVGGVLTDIVARMPADADVKGKMDFISRELDTFFPADAAEPAGLSSLRAALDTNEDSYRQRGKRQIREATAKRSGAALSGLLSGVVALASLTGVYELSSRAYVSRKKAHLLRTEKLDPLEGKVGKIYHLADALLPDAYTIERGVEYNPGSPIKTLKYTHADQKVYIEKTHAHYRNALQNLKEATLENGAQLLSDEGKKAIDGYVALLNDYQQLKQEEKQLDNDIRDKLLLSVGGILLAVLTNMNAAFMVSKTRYENKVAKKHKNALQDDLETLGLLREQLITDLTERFSSPSAAR